MKIAGGRNNLQTQIFACAWQRADNSDYVLN